MMNSKIRLQYVLAAWLTFSASVCNSANACTDFQVKADDGSVVVGRSMEWSQNLATKLKLRPAGMSRSAASSEGSKGLSWKSKYASIVADGYDLNVALDGINSEGLSVGFLWMPGAVYEKTDSSSKSESIDILDIGSWLLDNCATVDEALGKLSEVRITAKKQPALGGVPTVHLALHDATGKNAVIEFVDGQRKVYDNPNGVLTNAPTFDWHTTNLRNYIYLDNSNPKPVKLRGTVLDMPGQGGGFLGIPGDWTPPSRFVRTTAMLAFAKDPTNSESAVNMAQHILNAVDIPKGDVKTGEGEAGCDYTQWALIKDLTKKVIYYRTYDNLNLRKVEISKVTKLGPDEASSISIDEATPSK